jgi:hypothetical protein
MPIIDDPRYSRDTIVGPIRTELFATPQPEDDGSSPPLLDTLAAASRTSTLPGAAYSRITNPDPDLPDAPEGWDPLDDIAGYEEHAHNFIDAQTPGELAGIKLRLDAERGDREVLQRAGIGGPAAEIGLSLLDPSFLAAAAVPEIALAKAVRLGRALSAAGRGASGAAAYEGGMQALTEDRTALQSAITISGGAILGGVLGSLGRRMAPAEVSQLREAVALDLGPVNPGSGQDFGAASTLGRTTLAQESFARGGETLSKVAGKVPFTQTDLQVVMASESATARGVLQELADFTPLLVKNAEGIATPTSVEALVGRHEGKVAQFADDAAKDYVAYRARATKAEANGFPLPRDEQLSKVEFFEAIAKAARRGDQHAVQEVESAAKRLRAGFDTLKVAAQKLGLLPKDTEVVGAQSYFRRMYDRKAIRANRTEWDRTLIAHFVKEGGSPAEAVAAAEDVTRRILGADIGVPNFNERVITPNAGPLQQRTLNIADELIEPFLVNDPVRVLHSYVRELAPQIELARRFGDKDMKEAFEQVAQEFDVLRNQARAKGADSKRITQLEQQEKSTLEALLRIRERVNGRAGRISSSTSDGQRRLVELARGWRNIVASGKLGATAITSIPSDLGRIVATHGFARTFGRLTKFAVSPAVRTLSKVQARRLGAAVEVTLASRVNVAFDGAITQGWTEGLANGVYKYTGLNHWTDFSRTLAASLLEDQVLKVADDVVAGRAVDAFARTRLASLGLDESALRAIAAEVKANGATVDGIRMSGSGNWRNAALAERYDAAVLKESRVLVMQPGAANKVWWMDSETGRVLGQLKSFSLASPVRATMEAVQHIGAGRYMRGGRFIGAMMVGGYLSHVFRQLVAGKLPETDPAKAAGEAFSESSLGGVMPDLAAPLGRRVGLFGESARFSDANVASTFGGPAVGTAQDALEFAMTRSRGGISASDLHMLRRLMPYQNVWWARRAINALEGESAEGLDLKGADVSTFGERFLRTDELLPSKERGTTGTGEVVQ